MALVLALALSTACSPPSGERPVDVAEAPAALPGLGATAPGTVLPAAGTSALPSPPTSSHPATVSGTAPLPQDDVPAVVVLEPTQRYAYPTPAERPMMDQIATRFTPAALVVRPGRPTDFRNDDPTLHNVRARERGHAADDLAFNIALPQGVTYDYTFQKEGVWDIRCDVHQNMYGLVVATSSPYTAVAAADGTFLITGVAPGEYTAIAHTSRDRFEKRIVLDDDQHLTLTLR